MASESLNLGLSLTIPTNGTRNWATLIKNGAWIPISQHAHTGSGDGNPIGSAGIAADAITGAKIRLDNDEWLRARNAADSGDINILKVDADDNLQFGANIAKTQQTLTPVGTSQDVDFDLGDKVILDLSSASGDVTVNLLNEATGADYRIKVVQGGTLRTITWPANVKWPGGEEPSQYMSINSDNVVYLDFDGTDFIASWELNLG